MREKWGSTGRVELESSSRSTAAVRFRVDGEFVGHVAPYLLLEKAGLWFALPRLEAASPDLPSRDAAICWVLRRAAPDVWRAERPVVMKVERYEPISATPEGMTWLVYPKDDEFSVGWNDTWAGALAQAGRRARAEYARTVTR